MRQVALIKKILCKADARLIVLILGKPIDQSWVHVKKWYDGIERTTYIVKIIPSSTKWYPKRDHLKFALAAFFV